MNTSDFGQVARADFYLGLMLILLALYLISSLFLYQIARNCGEREDGWQAFVPHVDVILMLKIAGKPASWYWLFMVPGLNFVLAAKIWIAIARRCEMSRAWGVIAAIPLLNIVALAKMAARKPKPTFFRPPEVVLSERTPQNVR